MSDIDCVHLSEVARIASAIGGSPVGGDLGHSDGNLTLTNFTSLLFSVIWSIVLIPSDEEKGEVLMNNEKKMILGNIVGGLLVIVFVPSIIYIITSVIDTVFRIEIIPHPIIRWVILTILLVIGLIYGIWSVIIQNTLGEGGPVEIGNIKISPKTKNLIVSGPYKYTRNPMLFGTLLIYLAFTLWINSITSVVLVSAIFIFMLTVVVKMEEKRLLKDFGNSYEDYRKKVSMFIPWFHKKIE